jgi:DNA-binding NarL/FixJ family response regulator
VAEKLALDVLQGDTQDVLPHTRLSDREYQIFQAIVTGVSVSDIAQQLNLSVKTVSTHKTHIQEKMSCDSVADLVRYAIQHELLAGGVE